ncbi:hypothetical protein GCM10010360_28780 [Streptomyces nogalater]
MLPSGMTAAQGTAALPRKWLLRALNCTGTEGHQVGETPPGDRGPTSRGPTAGPTPIRGPPTTGTGDRTGDRGPGTGDRTGDRGPGTGDRTGDRGPNRGPGTELGTGDRTGNGADPIREPSTPGTNHRRDGTGLERRVQRARGSKRLVPTEAQRHSVRPREPAQSVDQFVRLIRCEGLPGGRDGH